MVQLAGEKQTCHMSMAIWRGEITRPKPVSKTRPGKSLQPESRIKCHTLSGNIELHNGKLWALLGRSGRGVALWL